MLAPWIISHFPEHRVYVEPFSGAASVLIRKERCYSEVYNDLDDDVVNLFSVVRDPALCETLITLLKQTPFSRTEWRAAYRSTKEPVERARRLLIRSFQGFGSASYNAEYSTGFRSNSNRSGTTPAHDWANFSDCLRPLIVRMQGVVIENRDALKLIPEHDSPETLFYVDPPYARSTRNTSGKVYRFEMDDGGHRALAELLHQVKGMVVLSGYASDLYDQELFPTWPRSQRPFFAGNQNGRSMRDEVLWINPACAARLAQREPLLL